MAKTTSKIKKPATAGRRKPTQLDRIEQRLKDTQQWLKEATDARVMAIDRRTLEHGKVLDSICRSLALDMGDRLKAHTDILHKIQADLSLLKSGASFMQELDRVAKEEQPVPREEPKEEWVPKESDWVVCDSSHYNDHKGDPYWTKTMEDHVGVPMQVKAVGEEYINAVGNFAYRPSWLRPATPAEIAENEAKIKAKEEEGLEPGDYTDASKEVADALTAMGWGWYDEDRVRLKWIVRANNDASCDQMINTSASRGHKDTHRTNADFLSRARVTAKKLGLVPREEPKEEWRPEAGQWIVSKEHDRMNGFHVGYITKCTHADTDCVGFVDADGARRFRRSKNWRPATPAEIAEHEAKLRAKEEEQKLACLKFGTRVKHNTGTMIYWYTLLNGKHKVVGQGGTFLEVKTSELTIID